MKIDSENNFVIFESTGREFYANRGIIGLSPSRELSTGYDDHLWPEVDGWTPEEKRELATYMIRQWAEVGGVDVEIF